MWATRAASEHALVDAAVPRLDALIAEGATTIEVKSGYGLDLNTEGESSCIAARALADGRLGYYRDDIPGRASPSTRHTAGADAYIDLVCIFDSGGGLGGPGRGGRRFL